MRTDDDLEEDFDHEESLDDDDEAGPEFADLGGRSALRAATPDNPRDRPCPTCGREEALTPLDVSLGYQCDACADRAEGRGP